MAVFNEKAVVARKNSIAAIVDEYSGAAVALVFGACDIVDIQVPEGDTVRRSKVEETELNPA
jgi:hypothetical protein